jgi:cyanophycinase-like exopeptidase
MKAIGNWVILKTQEEVSGSGIVSINDNICLVVDCNYDDSIVGKKAIYNASGNHFTYNEFIIVEWKDIMAVVE